MKHTQRLGPSDVARNWGFLRVGGRARGRASAPPFWERVISGSSPRPKSVSVLPPPPFLRCPRVQVCCGRKEAWQGLFCGRSGRGPVRRSAGSALAASTLAEDSCEVALAREEGGEPRSVPGVASERPEPGRWGAPVPAGFRGGFTGLRHCLLPPPSGSPLPAPGLGPAGLPRQTQAAGTRHRPLLGPHV